VDVAVVGSINRDVTVVAPHHPRPGETVLGEGHYEGNGGKGANQAVAAARSGATVAMIGRVGADVAGTAMVRALTDEGIDTEGVEVDPSLPTGLAVITLGEGAENTIVVSPGANAAVGPGQVSGSGAVAGAKVVLAQLEIPLEAVEAAAAASSGVFCLNPAPARDLPPELLSRVDVLVVNRAELATITGVMSERAEWMGTAARMIEGPDVVLVTLGAEGAVLVRDSDVSHFDSPRVEAVDTTGAGDAFCGALASAISSGLDIEDAVRRAVAAGALATTRPGAQTAMPTLDEIERLLAGE
jgi:ribokinase